MRVLVRDISEKALYSKLNILKFSSWTRFLARLLNSWYETELDSVIFSFHFPYSFKLNRSIIPFLVVPSLGRGLIEP
eukprot:snap_masked-scaffold_33-processed-gene-3.20-mRNA-1 protein AED:1.00 eAED:1.00 QI:0/0/0/0/1/1/3/0/76